MEQLVYGLFLVGVLGQIGMMLFLMAWLVKYQVAELMKKPIQEPIKKELKQQIEKNDTGWLVLGSSVTGKSHLEVEPSLPCQDSHCIKQIESEWGVAVVSDGLGSKSLSHIGSRFVADKMEKLLVEVVKQHMMAQFGEDELPTPWQWRHMSVSLLYNVYTQLKLFAEENDYPLDALACTVIGLIYTPYGLFICHIGDGRAGYRSTKEGTWKAMMMPINGEQSNIVMPITGNFWGSREYVDTFVNSSIIHERADAFVLMSDGCEKFAYETFQYDDRTGKVIDKNRPFTGFLDPLAEYIKECGLENRDKLEEEWHLFLTNGTPLIERESDDKTMILGVCT